MQRGLMRTSVGSSCLGNILAGYCISRPLALGLNAAVDASFVGDFSDPTKELDDVLIVYKLLLLFVEAGFEELFRLICRGDVDLPWHPGTYCAKCLNSLRIWLEKLEQYVEMYALFPQVVEDNDLMTIVTLEKGIKIPTE